MIFYIVVKNIYWGGYFFKFINVIVLKKKNKMRNIDIEVWKWIFILLLIEELIQNN